MKTAVEWYSENFSQLLMKLLKNELESEQDFPKLSRELREKAIEMEKKQIIDAVVEGQNFDTGEDYYDYNYPPRGWYEPEKE